MTTAPLRFRRRWQPRPLGALAAAFLGLTLAGCGGGSDGSGAPGVAEPLADTAVPLDIEVLPAFHMAALTLDEPAFADDSGAAALLAPHRQGLALLARGLDTTRLTPDGLDAQERRSTLAIRGGETADAAAAAIGAATPQSSVTVYTPAQVRAAYGLPAAPSTAGGFTGAAAAALGAGQTIYIVDAKHNPNALADLDAFSTRFGLPGCQTVAIALAAKLPLAVAPAGGCTVSVVYSAAAGGMTAAQPAYDAGWASEIALDLQWAHAIAPLARIVLIEAADAGINTLLGAVRLANAMGPGVVSMSFGTTEGSWVGGVDSAFRGAGMAYVAATGDAGAQVNWPAVSATVLAVGGTTLSYVANSDGSGTRSEVAWSRTGGGTSTVVARPAFQSTAPLKTRGVADVAFNADPYSGQYVAITRPGASAPGWYSMGGTSLAAPQWAGLTAVANAQRALAGRAVLGAPHAALYRIAAAKGGAFADVTSGSNGSCSGCTAAAGYDLPTGLGTPNAGRLLPLLSAAN